MKILKKEYIYIWRAEIIATFPHSHLQLFPMGIPGAVGSSSKAKAMQNFLFDSLVYMKPDGYFFSKEDAGGPFQALMTYVTGFCYDLVGSIPAVESFRACLALPS